jgi:hypothetical protein
MDLVRIMRRFYLLFAIFAPLAFAKAPLVNRDIHDGVPDNYIVVLKEDVDTGVLRDHYHTIEDAAKTLEDRRGLVRTYKIDGFHGYHVECDEEILEVIRNSAVVGSTPTFQILYVCC